MVGEVLRMDHGDALTIYSWFTTALVFSQVLGALVGDLFLGNKKALLIGGLAQAAGIFVLCFQTSASLYCGLILVILGEGLFFPNLLSQLNKAYPVMGKLKDAGYGIYFFGINIGSLFGVSLILIAYEQFGWIMGFFMAGAFMLIASFIAFLIKDRNFCDLHTHEPKPPVHRLQAWKYILIGFVLAVGFWALYDLAGYGMNLIESDLGKVLPKSIHESLLSSIGNSFGLLVAIVFILIWSYFYSDSLRKMVWACLLGGLSFIALYLFPDELGKGNILPFILLIFSLSISEFFIAPIIFSFVSKYVRPKFYATVISLYPVPIRLIGLLSGAYFMNKGNDSDLYLAPAGLGMMILAFLGGAFYFKYRKTSFSTSR